METGISARRRDGLVTQQRPGQARSVYCVMSLCPYAAQGLIALLKSDGRRARLVRSEEAGPLWPLPAGSRLIIYIPDEPVAVLTTLQMLALRCRQEAVPLPAIILSNLRADWLYRTLQKLTGDTDRLSALRIALPGLSLSALKGVLSHPELLGTLERRAMAQEEVDGRRGEGLSRRETEVVLSVLRGESILLQGRRQGRSCKTLYAQRLSGLSKMTEQFPHMAFLLPRGGRSAGGLLTGGKYMGLELSPEENAFEQAVHDGLVFLVFQPVTDRHLQVRGFEILIRWMRDGKELQPSSFLPAIRAVRTWTLLTAYVLSEAVRQINRTSGAYTFAVNIPVCLTEGGSLIRMVETARNQLKDRALARCLVLEFPEAADITQAGCMASIRQIQLAGHRVVLDDCFSGSSVIFPVRRVQFSGYKLDMSIVNTFMDNHNDMSLLASLVEYCHLTGAECVAEGVDSREKLLALDRVGVTAFQGYYISRPVHRELIDETVLQLKARNAKWNGGGE